MVICRRSVKFPDFCQKLQKCIQIYPATSLVVGVRSGVGRSVRVETAELLEPWRSFLAVNGKSCASSCFLENVDLERKYDA